MTKINPYLTFNGNCEDAFNYYKSVFGKEFSSLQRYKDMPPMEGLTPDKSNDEKILNVTLPVNDHNTLFGCDANTAFGQVTFGKNVTLSIEADSKEQADKFFSMLSDNGTAFMPMADMFWGAYFGMCEDKFGINWMVSFSNTL
jgi:PhnB protein